MSHATVYRQVSRVRRSPVPRRSAGGASAGLSAFGQMLSKLGLAERSLQQARPRRRRA